MIIIESIVPGAFNWFESEPLKVLFYCCKLKQKEASGYYSLIHFKKIGWDWDDSHYYRKEIHRKWQF